MSRVSLRLAYDLRNLLRQDRRQAIANKRAAHAIVSLTRARPARPTRQAALQAHRVRIEAVDTLADRPAAQHNRSLAENASQMRKPAVRADHASRVRQDAGYRLRCKRLVSRVQGHRAAEA